MQISYLNEARPLFKTLLGGNLLTSSSKTGPEDAYLSYQSLRTLTQVDYVHEETEPSNFFF